MIKIGASIISENINPSRVTEELYKKGICTIELEYYRDFLSKEIKRIKELDLNISMHCPFKDMRLKYSLWSLIIKSKFYFRKSFIKKLEKSFLTAERLEAKYYVLHGGGFPKGYFRFKQLRKKEKFLQALVHDLKPFFIRTKDSNVKILLENLMPNNIFEEPSDIKYVHDKFPWTGFCLDFAHSELTKQTDILKEIKIDHVHVSDNDLKKDTHLPVGEGKIDIFKLFSILHHKCYKGSIISENVNLDSAVKSVEKIKELFKNFPKDI